MRIAKLARAALDRRRADQALEHDPEKSCPALDAGWEPVFGKDHAQEKTLRAKTLWRSRDRNAAAGGDTHHGEAPLVGAVGAEAEQPVDPGKAGWAGQHIG